MKAYPFQEKAINLLTEKFIKLYNGGNYNCNLVFKSPTGSGKTFMTANFINSLNYLPEFEADIAFVWITFSDELAMQSKQKFEEYFFPNFSNTLLTIDDVRKSTGGKLKSNDILFMNWQKLVSKKASDRVFRRQEDSNLFKESGFYFEDVAENTLNENRDIILVIDESHKNVTEAAIRDVINPLNPRIIVKISATPESIPTALDAQNNLGDIVEVSAQEVVDEGLIKEEILSQTEEDMLSYGIEDHDILMLQLAMQKREELLQAWKNLGLNINPLVLIQLPDDDHKNKESDFQTKQEIVSDYLKQHGVEESKIAYWFDKNKKNLEHISDNDNPVEYMLFKYAAGTGWDCPRAHILVMYREIKSDTFRTQTLGRILRMPVHNVDLQGYSMLKTGFLYTNYSRNEVENPIDKKTENQPKTKKSGLNPRIYKKVVQQEFTFKFTSTVANNIKPTDENKAKAQDFIKSVISEIQQTVENVNKEIANEKLAVKHTEILNNAKNKIAKVISNQAELKFGEETQNNDFVSSLCDFANDFMEKQSSPIPNRDLLLDEALTSDQIVKQQQSTIKPSDFQRSFKASLNRYFDYDSRTLYQTEDLERLFNNKGVKLQTFLERDVIVNARFNTTTDDDYGKNIKTEMSRNDVEKEFSLRCAEIYKENVSQFDINETSGGFSLLKEALRQWFKQYFMELGSLEDFYKIFLNDVFKSDNSIFRIAIKKAFEDYSNLLKKVQAQTKSKQETAKPFVVLCNRSYPKDYKEFTPATKSFNQPFLLAEKYNGKKNETDFIEYLEKNQNVEWWYKNGDSGKDYLSIVYDRSIDNTKHLFYPDWIIKFSGNRIGIFDTKGGITATSGDIKDKASALSRRIKMLNQTSRRYKYIGGIIIKQSGIWLYNSSENYQYYTENSADWKEMEGVF